MVQVSDSEVELKELYVRVMSILRKFQEAAYAMLLKHVEGIRLWEFQAKLELAVGMEFHGEEVGFDRFVQFLLDCDFLEVRSIRTGVGNEFYLFVKEDWVDEDSMQERAVCSKYPGSVYKEDTILEESSALIRAIPVMATPTVSNSITGVEKQDLIEIKHTNGKVNGTETNEKEEEDDFSAHKRSPIVRIRRTTVFEQENDQRKDRRLTQVNYIRSRPGSQETDKNKAETNAKPSVGSSQMDLLGANCSWNAFPKFIWPKTPFPVRLLGCNFESYLYVRPEDPLVEKRYHKLKSALKDLSLSWQGKEGMISISRNQLKEGMIVLAMDWNTNLFCRALVLRVDEMTEDVEHPVSYLDLDEGEEFVASFAPTFVIPPEYRNLYFQAIKVGLEGHEEYFGTESLLPVFPMVPNLGSTLFCERVGSTTDSSKMPLVKLRYESGGPCICFKDFL